MAGLDPAAAATRQLVEQLLDRKGAAAQQQRITFDDFMKVGGDPTSRGAVGLCPWRGIPPSGEIYVACQDMGFKITSHTRPTYFFLRKMFLIPSPAQVVIYFQEESTRVMMDGGEVPQVWSMQFV